MSDGAKEIHALTRRFAVIYRLFMTAFLMLGPLNGVAEAKKKDKATNGDSFMGFPIERA